MNNESLRFLLYMLCTLFAAAGGIAALVRQLQMLQQNSYFPSRYLSWLKQGGKGSLICRVIFLLTICVLNLHNHLALLIVTVALFIYAVISIVAAVREQKKSVICLKVTARVRRMFGVAIAVFVLLAVLQFFFAQADDYWFVSAAAAFGILPQMTVLFAWVVLYPAEKKITKHYLRDAKKILSLFGDRLTVIGVTGSYGKTGTKNILYKLLSEKYNTFVTPKNFNTPMGVVRAVRESMPRETEVFICEMGAKKKGDIKELCDLVHPKIGIITSVGPQHLDTFGTIADVVSGKFELYDAVHYSHGTLYANADNEYIRARMREDTVTGYGTADTEPFYADKIKYGAAGTTFCLHLRGEEQTVHTRLLGAHNVVNIVGAAAVAYDMGVSGAQIAFAVSRLTPTEHRLELGRTVAGATLIDDAYNANPVGSTEACRVLARFEGMKKFIITPGLVELGEKEDEYNFALGKVAAECADTIILVGKQRSKPLLEGAKAAGKDENSIYVVSSFAEAMAVFSPHADQNTVLLIENDLPDNYLV